MNIPVINFTPSKGNDKHARVNAVAPLFESGMIWAPDQKFAEEVIEECAAFPNGDHDDLVDSTTQAIMRFRQGGLIGHPEDYIDEKKTLNLGRIINGSKIFRIICLFCRKRFTRKLAKDLYLRKLQIKLQHRKAKSKYLKQKVR